MITAKGIFKSFRQPDGSVKTALEDINLKIEDGQLAVLAGENGSGKSLLMKILSGLEQPTHGEVEASDSIGLVFQDADAQILADTPLEDILFGLRNNRDISKKQAMETALSALKKVGIGDKKDSPSHMLSGGEKRRLAIASILALGRKTVIFDEPYSNLDYPGVKSVNAIIKELKAGGLTVLLLTHELEKCLALADRFLVLHRGKLVFDGSPSEALKLDLESWGIRNPSADGKTENLVWS